MVHSMKPFAMVACGALLATTLIATAVGQTTPSLAYVQPVSPTAVQVVQEHLRSAGTYNGAVDGVWGPDSTVALQQFQSNHQLQASGQLNQATASALGIDLAALLGTLSRRRCLRPRICGHHRFASSSRACIAWASIPALWMASGAGAPKTPSSSSSRVVDCNRMGN